LRHILLGHSSFQAEFCLDRLEKSLAALGTDVALLKAQHPDPAKSKAGASTSKDVVAMPLNRSARITATPAPKRVRPANPSCRGGASSLLRLTQTASSRLPSAPALTEWMSQAASVMLPVTGPLASSWDAR
jgi:hypothetical protein